VLKVKADAHFLKRADPFIVRRRYDKPDEVDAGVFDFAEWRLRPELQGRGILLSLPFASPDFIGLAATETFLRTLRARKLHMFIFALEIVSAVGLRGSCAFCLQVLHCTHRSLPKCPNGLFPFSIGFVCGRRVLKS
jgi:hypothetical protein